MTQTPGKWNLTQPLEWGALIRDTLHLSAEEFGAYMLLIGHYWSTAKPLPDSPETLARIARVPIERWQVLRPVLEPFWRVDGGLWHHKRIDADLASTWDLHQARVAQTAAARAANPKNAAKRTVTDTVTEAELPWGFPATEQEAVEHAAFVGCTPDFAAKCWHKAMSRLGHDAKGVAIGSWRHHLAFAWALERERPHREAALLQGSGPTQPAQATGNMALYVAQKEFERVQQRMSTIRSQYDQHQSWSADDRTEWAKLKGRKAELQKQLGVQV